MSEIQIIPTLQSQREIDTMPRSITRDCDKVREFISKEKNPIYKTELTKIFSQTLSFAEKYDGCTSDVMMTPAFKKDALATFTMIANQRRGGRKILFVLLSSPTSGLDQHYASWWPTVRGLDTSSVHLMESFLKRLSIEIAAEADGMDISFPPPTLSDKDAEVMWKKRLEFDILKIVREKVDGAEGPGYSIASSGDATEFTMTVRLLKEHDDSGVGDNDSVVKKEMPTPVIAFNPPKSEAARTDSSARPVDKDGFWIDSSDNEDEFVQVAKMTPKGDLSILFKLFTIYDS